MSTINRLFGTFEEPVSESGFREWSLPQDRARARVAMFAAIAVVLASIRSDYLLFGTDPPFPQVVAARSVFVLYTTVTAILMSRLLTPRAFDRGVSIWSLVVAATVLYVSHTRPDGYLAHLVMDVIAVFFLVAVLPNQFRFQVASAALVAAGVVVVARLQGLTQEPVVATVVFAAFPLALGFGGFVSWDSHLSRRRLYAAMLEVRDLRSIVPMCSRCRRVRNDEGFWRKVEVYLSEHTEMEFSHGYCEECYAAVTVDLK